MGSKKVLSASKYFQNIITIVGLLGGLISIYTFFFNSFAPPLPVTVLAPVEASSCNGFLINDPPDVLFKKLLPSKKEKEYLENKIECYRNQIQKNKNDAGAYTNLGEANRRLGNLLAARQCHEMALQINPKLPEAHIGLAILEQEEARKTKANKFVHNALKKNADSLDSVFKEFLSSAGRLARH